MKVKIIFFLFIILLFVSCKKSTKESIKDFKQVQSTYIAKWLNNKDACVSLTFDDNLKSQLEIAIPEMNKYNYKGTFFVLAQWLDNQACLDPLSSKWLNVFKSGHEIGCHSYSHNYLTWLDNDELEKQVKYSKDVIESIIGKGNCNIFRHPWLDYNNNTIKTVNRYFTWSTEDLDISINPTVSWTRSFFGMKISLENIIKNKSWLISGFHGIENDFLEISLNDFKQYLELLHSKEEQLWIAPMGDIIKYLVLRENIIIKEINENTVKITINNKNIPFDYSTQILTFITRVDNNNFYKITAGNKKIFSIPLKDEKGYYLVYNIIPKFDIFKINIEPVTIPKSNLMTEIKSYTFSKENILTDWDLIQGKYSILDGSLHLEEGMSKIVLKKDLKNFFVKGKLKINSNGVKSRSFSYTSFFIRAKEVLRGENNGIYYALDCHSSISDYRTNQIILWEQKMPHAEFSWYWPDMLLMTNPVLLNADKWYTFELLVKDNIISLKIDDSTCFVFDDLPINQGLFGLNNRGLSVDFDDLNIYEIK